MVKQIDQLKWCHVQQHRPGRTVFRNYFIDPSKINRVFEVTAFNFTLEIIGEVSLMLNNAAIHIYKIQSSVWSVSSDYRPESFVGACKKLFSLICLLSAHFVT